MRAPLPDLLVFTDTAQARTRARGVVETIARALVVPRDGIAVIVREKGKPLADVRLLCGALLPIARRARALLLVHTHADLVEQLDLDGVHLSSTAEVGPVRARLPSRALLGASRHAGDALHGLDYATVSPVFSPTSKSHDARAPLGLDGLRAQCETSGVAVYALGGITDRNARACLDAGARGVAVLGGVMGAFDPARALDALHARVTRGTVTRG